MIAKGSTLRVEGAPEYLDSELNRLLRSVICREFQTARRPARVDESGKQETV